MTHPIPDDPAADAAWHEREYLAQRSRIMPVWHQQSWRRDCWQIWPHHYVHVSEKDRTLLAYTQDADKGRRNIQTPIKPGKYLTKYFSEILTPKQIAFYAAWQATGMAGSRGYDKAPLMFARTADEIEAVYVAGPDSCMSGSRGDYSGSCHPVRVYAADDLAIAYLHGTVANDPDNMRPIARALVWPDKKVFGRVYPTDHCWQTDKFANIEDSKACASELFNRLMAEGYQQDTEHRAFNGARLRRIECDNGAVVMPYLDWDYCFDDADHGFVMSNRGDYAANGTEGVAQVEPNHTWTCEHCENGMTDDEEQNCVYSGYRNGRARNSMAWCNHCTENHAFYCHGTQDTYSDDVESTTADGETVCQRWADDNCVYSDHSEEYHKDATAVEMANGETWTDAEFAVNGFTCAIDGKNYPNNERHAMYRDIHQDTTEEDIADYLNGLVANDTGLIHAPAQKELIV